MTKNLFDLCMTISDIIAPVLKSDSPEGFVFEDGQATKVTAQILLLCAWRTSKEISLILGHLSQNPELMKEISDLFVNQLSEIKHRGAFEQAFIGNTYTYAGCPNKFRVLRNSNLKNIQKIRQIDRRSAFLECQQIFTIFFFFFTV